MARRRSRRQTPDVPLPVLALGLVGLSLVAWGLAGNLGLIDSGSTENAATQQAESGAGASPTAPAHPGSVQPGTGTYENPAPEVSSDPTDGARCAGCDVVLITVCSLRRDHVGAYGADLAKTPAIDRIALGNGLRFDRAYAASNFTLASLTSVLTGRFGSSTGVIGWDKGLTRDVHTLPEVLGYYGYRTAAFTTDAPSGFRPDYGLDRGFQHMEITLSPRGTPDGRHRGGVLGPPGETADPVVDWLAKQDDAQPLFVMFHTRTAHFPFVIEADDTDATGMSRLLWEAGMKAANKRSSNQAMPGMAGGTQQQGIVEFGPDPLQVRINELGEPAERVWRQRYAEAVELMDADVAAVLQAIDARGRADRTIIALVADHGESLNDHSELLHGDAYFDGVINVPMVLSIPGQSSGSRTELVSQVDLMPTLLELVGAVPPTGIDGVSMLPLIDEGAAIRGTALSEGGVARQIGPHPVGAVISPPWTLLRQHRGCGPTSPPATVGPGGAPPTCLFNMDRDPQQLRSVASEHPEVVAELVDRWAGFRKDSKKAMDLDLSPEFVEELRKNGYDFRLGAP